MADRLTPFGTTLLNAAVAALEEFDRPVPDFRFVAGGEVAWDCTLLAVQYIRGYSGMLGREAVDPIKCFAPRTHVFQIVVLRCAPIMEEGGDPPPASELNTYGLEVLADAWALQVGILHRYEAGDFGDCQNFAIADATELGPEGALGGVALTVAAEV